MMPSPSLLADYQAWTVENQTERSACQTLFALEERFAANVSREYELFYLHLSHRAKLSHAIQHGLLSPGKEDKNKNEDEDEDEDEDENKKRNGNENVAFYQWCIRTIGLRLRVPCLFQWEPRVAGWTHVQSQHRVLTPAPSGLSMDTLEAVRRALLCFHVSENDADDRVLSIPTKNETDARTLDIRIAQENLCRDELWQILQSSKADAFASIFPRLVPELLRVCADVSGPDVSAEPRIRIPLSTFQEVWNLLPEDDERWEEEFPVFQPYNSRVVNSSGTDFTPQIFSRQMDKVTPHHEYKFGRYSFEDDSDPDSADEMLEGETGNEQIQVWPVRGCSRLVSLTLFSLALQVYDASCVGDLLHHVETGHISLSDLFGQRFFVHRSTNMFGWAPSGAVVPHQSTSRSLFELVYQHLFRECMEDAETTRPLMRRLVCLMKRMGPVTQKAADVTAYSVFCDLADRLLGGDVPVSRAFPLTETCSTGRIRVFIKEEAEVMVFFPFFEPSVRRYVLTQRHFCLHPQYVLERAFFPIRKRMHAPFRASLEAWLLQELRNRLHVEAEDGLLLLFGLSCRFAELTYVSQQHLVQLVRDAAPVTFSKWNRWEEQQEQKQEQEQEQNPEHPPTFTCSVDQVAFSEEGYPEQPKSCKTTVYLLAEFAHDSREHVTWFDVAVQSCLMSDGGFKLEQSLQVLHEALLWSTLSFSFETLNDLLQHRGKSDGHVRPYCRDERPEHVHEFIHPTYEDRQHLKTWTMGQVKEMYLQTLLARVRSSPSLQANADGWTIPFLVSVFQMFPFLDVEQQEILINLLVSSKTTDINTSRWGEMVLRDCTDDVQIRFVPPGAHLKSGLSLFDIALRSCVRCQKNNDWSGFRGHQARHVEKSLRVLLRALPHVVFTDTTIYKVFNLKTLEVQEKERQIEPKEDEDDEDENESQRFYQTLSVVREHVMSHCRDAAEQRKGQKGPFVLLLCRQFVSLTDVEQSFLLDQLQTFVPMDETGTLTARLGEVRFDARWTPRCPTHDGGIVFDAFYIKKDDEEESCLDAAVLSCIEAKRGPFLDVAWKKLRPMLETNVPFVVSFSTLQKAVMWKNEVRMNDVLIQCWKRTRAGHEHQLCLTHLMCHMFCDLDPMHQQDLCHLLQSSDKLSFLASDTDVPQTQACGRIGDILFERKSNRPLRVHSVCAKYPEPKAAMIRDLPHKIFFLSESDPCSALEEALLACLTHGDQHPEAGAQGALTLRPCFSTSLLSASVLIDIFSRTHVCWKEVQTALLPIVFQRRRIYQGPDAMRLWYVLFRSFLLLSPSQQATLLSSLRSPQRVTFVTKTGETRHAPLGSIQFMSTPSSYSSSFFSSSSSSSSSLSTVVIQGIQPLGVTSTFSVNPWNDSAKPKINTLIDLALLSCLDELQIDKEQDREKEEERKQHIEERICALLEILPHASLSLSVLHRVWKVYDEKRSSRPVFQIMRTLLWSLVDVPTPTATHAVFALFEAFPYLSQDDRLALTRFCVPASDGPREFPYVVTPNKDRILTAPLGWLLWDSLEDRVVGVRSVGIDVSSEANRFAWTIHIGGCMDYALEACSWRNDEDVLVPLLQVIPHVTVLFSTLNKLLKRRFHRMQTAMAPLASFLFHQCHKLISTETSAAADDGNKEQKQEDVTSDLQCFSLLFHMFDGLQPPQQRVLLASLCSSHLWTWTDSDQHTQRCRLGDVWFHQTTSIPVMAKGSKGHEDDSNQKVCSLLDVAIQRCLRTTRTFDPSPEEALATFTLLSQCLPHAVISPSVAKQVVECSVPCVISVQTSFRPFTT